MVQRLSVGTREIPEGDFFWMSSRRSNLKFAEWLAAQHNITVNVNSTDKFPFGLFAPSSYKPAQHHWSCAPDCREHVACEGDACKGVARTIRASAPAPAAKGASGVKPVSHVVR